MNTTRHAVRVGIGRGWTEFKNSMVAPQDLSFYIFVGGGGLAWLIANRNDEVEGTSLSLPHVAVPSVLAAMLVFGMVIGPAYQIAIEREDGTLLRAKALPNGMVGYVSGMITLHSASMVPALGILFIPSLFLFDGLMTRGAVGWLMFLGLLVLGTLATMPIGMIIGSVVRNSRQVGTWGMLPIIGMVAVSGIFTPMSSLPGVVQGIGQVFPMYWLGLGMRSTFLPDSVVTYEMGDSWRTFEVFGVLGAWAAVGLVTVPFVLRRMARRESGSAVEARKQEAMQRIG